MAMQREDYDKVREGLKKFTRPQMLAFREHVVDARNGNRVKRGILARHPMVAQLGATTNDDVTCLLRFLDMTCRAMLEAREHAE